LLGAALATGRVAHREVAEQELAAREGEQPE